MTITEFLKEHGLNCRDVKEEVSMMVALDKMYLELQPEQIVRLVLDYCDQADDIYNDTAEAMDEGFKTLEKLLGNSEEK